MKSLKLALPGNPQKRPRLSEAVAESPGLARTTTQAPWLRGSGGGFSSRYGSTGGGTLQSAEAVPQAGAWAGFPSNGLLAKRLGSAITVHGPWE